MVEDCFYHSMLKNRVKRALTIRCRRLATAAIFSHTLLAKALISVSDFANPQAPELKR
jgi:hypothetical protein